MPDAPAWPDLGPVHGWCPPAGTQRIDLLSDVHLHPAMPRTFEAWRAHLLHTPAEVVLVLGDLFELWVGDDARGQGFEADCCAVLREATRQRVVGLMPGNRDFLVGAALCADTGVQALADPTLLQAFGQRWLLSHGDALCLGDHDYMAFRAQVRSPVWQAQFLAQPLPLRLAQARQMRDASSQRQALMAAEDLAEVDGAAAAHWLAQAGAPTLVHGHTHRPARHRLPGGRERVVLGDWDLDQPPYRAQILRLSAQGLQALDLADSRHSAGHSAGHQPGQGVGAP